MSAEQIRHRIEDGAAIVTLDNPPLNLVSVEMTRQLDELLQALAGNASVRALVLHGAGEKAFCAGSDIGEFERYMTPRAAVTEKMYAENVMYSRLARFPWPTVAYVQGVAFGGGLELAACCDLILADERARFALPEVRLGVFPASGGTVRITRRIGAGRMKQMVLLGDPIDAGTALSWGLINLTFPDGEGLEQAISMGKRLAKGPASMRLAKQAIDMAFDLPEEDAVARTLPLIDAAFVSDDCREGVDAFRQKRPPTFTGS